jgi:hypothetical protein
MAVAESNSCVPSTLTELCQEAVERCGGDWTEIRSYLTDRIDNMSGDDQRRLKDELDRILSFVAPLRSSFLQ